MAVCQDLLRFTTDQQGSHAPTTMRRHDDKIAVLLCRNTDDRFVRVGPGCRDRVALHTGGGSSFRDYREIVIAALPGDPNEALLGIRDHLRAVREDVELRKHVDACQFGAVFARERNRHLDRGFGKCRSVSRHQQMFEHSFSPAARLIRLDVPLGARRLNRNDHFQYSQPDER